MPATPPPADPEHASTSPGTEPSEQPAPALGLLRKLVQERLLGPGQSLHDANGVPQPQPPVPNDGVVYAERPNGNALGDFIAVNPPSSLARFHARLSQLEHAPEPGQKLRVVVYGASHTEGDYYTSYLRYYLQARFGNGGQGFVALGKVNDWYRLLSTRVESAGLRAHYAQSMKPEVPGRFGLLGTAFGATSGAAFGRVATRDEKDERQYASLFEFSYLAAPTSGDLLLQVDGEPPVLLSGKADVVQNRVFSFTRELGPHAIEVHPRGNGPVRWFGVTMERPESGIVVDTLGISGTRAANLLTWDESLWFELLKRRDPALVVLAYGTNEALDHGEPIELYRQHLGEVIDRVRRATPDASCVLLGPGDFQKRTKAGDWAPRSRTPLVVQAQQEIAAQHGCGFWDLARFMGGPGAIERWVRANPQMAAEDRIHFTPRGYVRVGTAFTDALLDGYDVTAPSGAP